MREHTLEGTGGLTYAQMGRFQSAANPDDPAGTSDEEAAAKFESGEPDPERRPQHLVTETALTTALNMSYMAERLALFGIVVGFALLLTGIGLVLAIGGASARPARSRPRLRGGRPPHGLSGDSARDARAASGPPSSCS